MDLTGYKIEISRTMGGLAWQWDATDPDGDPVPKTLATHGACIDKKHAEENAVQACEERAAEPEAIDAEALRARLST